MAGPNALGGQAWWSGLSEVEVNQALADFGMEPDEVVPGFVYERDTAPFTVELVKER
jgi:hypothetical protein